MSPSVPTWPTTSPDVPVTGWTLPVMWPWFEIVQSNVPPCSCSEPSATIHGPDQLPANGLALAAASAVAAPTSRTATVESAASAMHPVSAHRVIDRVIVHL